MSYGYVCDRSHGCTYTPPKWVQAQHNREAPVLLEERLMHFIKWAYQRGVRIEHKRHGRLQKDEIEELVLEYVNT